MITVTTTINGATVTIQHDDLKALRAVLELLEDVLERRDLNIRIEELEHTIELMKKGVAPKEEEKEES